MRALVIGTRGSRLALCQVEIVREALAAAHPGIALTVQELKTEGDQSSAPLSEIGGLGVFTRAIEVALLERRIDMAVHSLKDLPPAETEGLTIAAIPDRGDPRDALVATGGRTLAELPHAARIGTGSARRAAQLLRLRSDVEPVDIRGNVDTRVRKVEEGTYDAAVLAYAGLRRLGLESKASQVFTVDEMIPAVGQACLAVQVRADDAAAVEIVRAIDHADSRAAATCERAFLARLGAGCRLPVGAYAQAEGGRLHVRAMLQSQAGRILTAQDSGHDGDALEIGARLADALLASAERVDGVAPNAAAVDGLE